MEDRILELNDLLSNKLSRLFTFTSKKSCFTTKLDKPLQLQENRKYEACLHYFSAYNTIFNINTMNNKFIYSHDLGKTWTTIAIPNGAYELSQINIEIQRQMKIKDHYDITAKSFYISIELNVSTSKAVIIISNKNYQVDFTKGNTICSILGFNSKIIKDPYNIADTIIQITNITAILIDCDIIEGSYINGKESNVIYSFPAFTVPLGYKMNIMVTNPIYLPVGRQVIRSISFKITDEEGHLIDFNGEEIALAIHLRQV